MVYSAYIIYQLYVQTQTHTFSAFGMLDHVI